MEIEELQKVRMQKIKKITKDIEDINKEILQNPSIIMQLLEKVQLLQTYL